MITNADVAAHLKLISQLESLAGNDRFKVRAFQNAAEGVSSLGVYIGNFAANGTLENITGVGKSAAIVINEYLNTLTSTRLEELSKIACPASVMEFTRVRGVGVKTAYAFWKEGKVSTFAELVQAVQSPQSWISEKLRKAVFEEAAHGLKRIPHEQAKALAQYVVDNLLSDVVHQIMICGSIRRQKTDSKDVDLVAVVSPELRPIVTRRLGELGVLHEVGEAKAGALIEYDGIRMNVDLWYTTADRFGAATLYATGSKEYCVKLRTLAASKGMRLNEKGLFKDDDVTTLIASKTESEIVEALGFSYIEPTMR